MADDRFLRLRAKVKEFNKRTTDWGKDTHNLAVGYMTYLDIQSGESKHTTNLKENFRVSFRREREEGELRISRISFSFPFSGAFVQWGVGRGYKMNETNVKKSKKTRRPKNWFFPPVNHKIPELDEIVKDYGDDYILNTTDILIGSAIADEAIKSSANRRSKFGREYSNAKGR